MTGRVVHFEIPYDDGERARAFYRDAFGWDVSEVPGMGYTMVSTGPTADGGPEERGFINGGMAERSDVFAHPAMVVDVDDIDEALGRIEELGGETLLGRTPVGDIGFSAYFRDPEGNAVGLWQNVHSHPSR